MALGLHMIIVVDGLRHYSHGPCSCCSDGVAVVAASAVAAVGMHLVALVEKAVDHCKLDLVSHL